MEQNLKYISGSLDEESGRLSTNASRGRHSPQVRNRPYLKPTRDIKLIFVNHARLPVRKSNKLLSWFKNFEFQAKKIDVFSRVFFPFVFAVFNIWYWSFYLSRSGE